MPIDAELMSVSPPSANAGMPGAPALRHRLHDLSILENEVVRRHLALGRTQTLKRLLGTLHSGVVQKDHVGCATVLALIMVGRG